MLKNANLMRGTDRRTKLLLGKRYILVLCLQTRLLGIEFSTFLNRQTYISISSIKKKTQTFIQRMWRLESEVCLGEYFNERFKKILESFEFVSFFTLISLSLYHRGKSKGSQANKPNKNDADKRDCESSSGSDESEDDEEITIRVSWTISAATCLLIL